jgi:hypothetical protein
MIADTSSSSSNKNTKKKKSEVSKWNKVVLADDETKVLSEPKLEQELYPATNQSGQDSQCNNNDTITMLTTMPLATISASLDTSKS